MNNKTVTGKVFFNNVNVKMIVSALAVFVGVLTYVPQASVIRSFPFVALFALVAYVLYPNVKCNVTVVFVLTFVMYCLYANTVLQSLVFSVVAVVVSLAAICCKFLAGKMRQSKSAALRKRCLIYLFVVAAVSLALYIFMCGNVFSSYSNHAFNKEYVNKNYADKINVKYTNFDYKTLSYKTYIDFVDGVDKIDENEYFISKKKGKITDGYRDYFEDKMLVSSEMYLSGIIENATDAFRIVASEIDFENNEIISPDADYENYLERTSYVVGLYSIIDTKDDFERLCRDCISQLEENKEFAFERIVLCGGNSAKIKFALELDTKQTLQTATDNIREFSQDELSGFGISEKHLLDYWLNK